jgi:hypothetical protein
MVSQEYGRAARRKRVQLMYKMFFLSLVALVLSACAGDAGPETAAEDDSAASVEQALSSCSAGEVGEERWSQISCECPNRRAKQQLFRCDGHYWRPLVQTRCTTLACHV